MEIYNESVRDLLSVDNTPLRVLDDPEVNSFISMSMLVLELSDYLIRFSNRKKQIFLDREEP